MSLAQSRRCLCTSGRSGWLRGDLGQQDSRAWIHADLASAGSPWFFKTLVLRRHVRRVAIAQVVIYQKFKSFLRISIRTWLIDQNPCETSHFLAIGVVTWLEY